MWYGVSYYPEHKNKEEIEKDIKLLIDSGINMVRMGEFAWCRFEPSEGQWSFEWLDDVVGRLGEHGIQTVICTPTACPPNWLAKKYPEIKYTDNRGVVRPIGGRREYCYNNPIYQAYSRKIAKALGEHYGNHPYVLGFQIDNELAQEATGRCHCLVCRGQFQQWLQAKYGTIQELNKRWGTIFWSREYDDFDEIEMPVNTIEVGATNLIEAYYENPSLRLDYERFCSESNISYQQQQLDELKRHTDKIITTNATGMATNSIDYYEAFKELDCYSFDYYPSLRDLEVDSFPYAFARGVKEKSFWVLEFVSGGGHRLNGSGRMQPYPNALKQSVMHAFASGAELLAHFQFKTFPFGAEQLNYAIVDADGIPRRRYFEMQAMARELKQVEVLLKESVISNEVAICFDYDCLWSHKIKPINEKSFDYLNYCNEIYQACIEVGVGVDVISKQDNFEKYKLVISPAHFVMGEEDKEKIRHYIHQGGVVVASFLTAAKNMDNVGLAESLPCGLSDVFGVCISEVEPVFESNALGLKILFNDETIESKDSYWSELLECKTAKALGVYQEDYKKEQAVITKNQYHQGYAYYVGTGLEKKAMQQWVSVVAREHEISCIPFKFEQGVEVIERQYKGKSVYFIFNFLKTQTTIYLSEVYEDFQSKEEYKEMISIGPKEYVIMTAKEEKGE